MTRWWFVFKAVSEIHGYRMITMISIIEMIHLLSSLTRSFMVVVVVGVAAFGWLMLARCIVAASAARRAASIRCGGGGNDHSLAATLSANGRSLAHCGVPDCCNLQDQPVHRRHYHRHQADPTVGSPVS